MLARCRPASPPEALGAPCLASTCGAHPRAALLVLCATLVAPGGTASAQNLEPFYYSDDASLTAGAVTATTRDGGAAWYNPAGLGAQHRAQVDLSGSTYGLRFRPVSGAITGALPGASVKVDLTGFDVISAPSAVSYVRAVSRRVTLAFGAFVTDRDVRSSTEESRQDIAGPAATGFYRQRFDLTLDRTTYQLGPAIGVALSETVRLGFAIFVGYTSQSVLFQYLLEAQAQGGMTSAHAFGLSQIRSATQALGGMATAGLQWDFAPGWSLGALLRSPQLSLASWANGTTVELLASTSTGTAGQANLTLTPPPAGAPLELMAPPRLTLGLARTFGDSYLALEVEVAAPLDNEARGIHRRWTVNGRLGGRWQATRRVALGLGVFTDLAPQPAGGDAFSERVDYFGGTLGLSFRTQLALVKDPRPDALVLVTTISLRYALGVGQFQGIAVDAAGNAAAQPVSVLYQEVVPYLGSSLLF